MNNHLESSKLVLEMSDLLYLDNSIFDPQVGFFPSIEINFLYNTQRLKRTIVCMHKPIIAVIDDDHQVAMSLKELIESIEANVDVYPHAYPDNVPCRIYF